MLRATHDLRTVIRSKGYRYDRYSTARWMGQLCGGAAFLERKGIAHGDLRPDNLLIDQNGNLRIHDLGSALAVGQRLPVRTEPFARMLAKEDGIRGGTGTYGWAGPCTENFAIGSILYSLTRGHYPYEREKYSPRNLGELFRRKEFPPLNDAAEDEIIAKCWHRGYESVA